MSSKVTRQFSATGNSVRVIIGGKLVGVVAVDPFGGGQFLGWADGVPMDAAPLFPSVDEAVAHIESVWAEGGED